MNSTIQEVMKLQAMLSSLKSKPAYQEGKKEMDGAKVKLTSNKTADARALMNSVIASGKSPEVFKMVNFTPKFDIAGNPLKA